MLETSIRNFHLWKSLPDELWTQLAQSMNEISYSTGETIFPTKETEFCLCFVRQGQAKVYAQSPVPDRATLLRTMDAGAIFGVHCIFNASMLPQSHIVATKPCRILTVPSERWEQVLACHPETMANYIRFLTQRIQFLNRKIRYLTAGSAERRLALYLLSEIPQENTPVRLDLSAVLLADLLNLGRASLYRAMTQLKNDGFLVRNGHEYCLLHRDKLFTHYR